MSRQLLACLLPLVLVAGCAEPVGPVTPGPDPPSNDGPIDPVVYSLHNTTQAGVYANPILPERWGSLTLEFNTTRNATAVLVELAWNDTLQDMDARMSADVDHCGWQDPVDEAACVAWGDALGDGSLQFGIFQDHGGNPGMGDSPSRAIANGEWLSDVLEACTELCHWSAYAWSRTPVANVEWDLYVSVFYGPVPEGYTALPS